MEPNTVLHPDVRKLVLETSHYRTIPVVREQIDEEKRTIHGSFSSVNPIVRWWGIEVLRHTPEAVVMGRAKLGLAFLMDHNPNDQRGRIENFKIVDTARTEGDVKISRHARGEELWMDMKDGIRDKTSIGYMIHEYREVPPEEMTEEVKNLALDMGVPVIEATRWEPIEVSSVSIPADMSVGMGRSLEFLDGMKEQKINEVLESLKRSQESKINISQTIKPEGERKMTPEEKKVYDQDMLKLERERVNEIEAFGKAMVGRIANIDDLVARARKEGMTVAEFKGIVADNVRDSKPVFTPADTLGLSDGDKKRYSLARAIHAIASGKPELAPLEMECSNAISKQRGPAGDKRSQGFWLPPDIQARPNRVTPDLKRLADIYGLMTRDLSVGTTTAGGHLVGTELDASSFIELLRNEMIFQQLGAKTLYGLVGNLDIPKQTGAGTFYHVSTEGNAPTESQQTFGKVSLSPKIGGTYTDYTYQLLIQSNPSIDGLVMEDLALVCALGVDKHGFHGSGASGQPTGIAATSGVGAVDGSSFSWAEAIEFITDVWAANARVKSCAYATDPVTWGLLKQRQRFLNTDTPLIDDNDRMAGHLVAVSNQITAGYMFHGNFAQAIVGFWGDGINILVDPYTASNSGTTRVRALVAYDIAVRIAAAFSVSSNMA